MAARENKLYSTIWAVPAICGSLGGDKVALGVVGTVFAMVYGICVPFAGLTADIFNRIRKKLFWLLFETVRYDTIHYVVKSESSSDR